MANLKFSPNISDEVKKRTEEFFDLVNKKYENKDKSSEGYKKELLAREDELLTLVKNIIDFKAFDDNGYTALIWAATKGYTKVVEALIKAGADVNATSNDGYTALIEAAYNGHTEVVEALIEARAELNTKDIDGYTALIWAATKGYTKVVEALIKAGADVNATSNDGYTALIEAAYNGHTEVVEALIEARAELNTKDIDGYTALIWAADSGYTEIVEVLIAAGADVNATANGGYTALIWAAYQGHTEIVEALIAAGANIYLADNDGKTAKDYIKEKLGEDYFNKVAGEGIQFYNNYATSTECPNNVEDVLKLLAFHPIAPSDNREPFPKMKMLESMFWNKDWGLDQACNLIDALKKRKVINEDESAKLKGFCNYKIAAKAESINMDKSPQRSF